MIIGVNDKGFEIIKHSLISKKIEFIPLNIIDNVVIHEQIKVLTVETFIAFMFKKEGIEYQSKFPPLLPIMYEIPLTISQKQSIYKAIHHFLFPNFNY